MNNRLEEQRYVQPEMIAASINFWFNDNDHVRSPFPVYLKGVLEDAAIMRFLDWTDKLDDAAKKEINDDILLERFEEIMFEAAMEFVKSDDERITIQYPFMIRLGDQVTNPEGGVNPPGKSVAVRREIKKEGDQTFLQVQFKTLPDGQPWETSFELP